MIQKLKCTSTHICLGSLFVWLYTSNNFRLDILCILSHVAPDNYSYHYSYAYVRQVAVSVIMKQPRAYQCFRR